jgi:sugar lactone lactonase YvrE
MATPARRGDRRILALLTALVTGGCWLATLPPGHPGGDMPLRVAATPPTGTSGAEVFEAELVGNILSDCSNVLPRWKMLAMGTDRIAAVDWEIVNVDSGVVLHAGTKTSTTGCAGPFDSGSPTGWNLIGTPSYRNVTPATRVKARITVRYGTLAGGCLLPPFTVGNTLETNVWNTLTCASETVAVPTPTPTPVAATGVSTFTGNLSNLTGSTDGTATAARFNRPQGLTADAAGNLYVADTFNHRIRKITPTRIVTTIGGSDKLPLTPPGANTGWVDGAGNAAKFRYPHGIAVNPAGTLLYVADTFNHRIRRIDLATNAVTTLAGNGQAGSTAGTGTTASFNLPWDVAVAPAGQIYVTDNGSGAIRRVTAAGTASTLITGLSDPRGIGIDGTGNVLVAETGANRILRVSPAGVTTVVATGLDTPTDVTVDAAGQLYVTTAAAATSRLEVVPAPGSSPSPLTGDAHGAADGDLVTASLRQAYAVTLSRGMIYLAEFGNNRIRQVSTGVYIPAP